MESVTRAHALDIVFMPLHATKEVPYRVPCQVLQGIPALADLSLRREARRLVADHTTLVPDKAMVILWVLEQSYSGSS